MNENWKAIEGYENYEISDHGNLRNIKTQRIRKPYINGLNKSGYYHVDLTKNKTKAHLKIHRLVAQAFLENPENKKCVDHIDRNRLNNHISNLRFATNSENGMNKSKHSNNISGIVGVCFCKTKNKWKAKIQQDGKSKHLGFFESKEEAIQARQNAEETYYKEFRPQNINISNSSNITINNS